MALPITESTIICHTAAHHDIESFKALIANNPVEEGELTPKS